MIHACLNTSLSADAENQAERMLAELASLQGDVDREATYAIRIEEGKRCWERGRKRRVFDTVRRLLASMCPGNGRCMFCEDTAASDVEHFLPKTLHPELVFVWANFLYACAICNGPAYKGTKLKVRMPNGTIVDLIQGRNNPVVPPTYGEPLLINPRDEDPLDLLALDLETGVLAERHKSGFKCERAIYTIKTLGLNDRETLVQARKNTYTAALDLLEKIAQLMSSRAPAEDIRRRKEAILRHTHRTVWEEMRRQRGQYRQLRALFQQVPEALNW
jgi:hypothetical protein